MSSKYTQHLSWIECVDLVITEIETRLPQYYTPSTSWYQIELPTIHESQLKRVTICVFHTVLMGSRFIYIERDNTDTSIWNLTFYNATVNKSVSCKVISDSEPMGEKQQCEWDNAINSLIEFVMPPKNAKRAQPNTKVLSK